MPEIHYNKLVRDNIPTIIKKQGKKPIAKKITDDIEFQEYLGKKLIEESNEYLETKEFDELIDVMEIIYSILSHMGINLSDFEKRRLSKKKERGGFEERILLLKVIE